MLQNDLFAWLIGTPTIKSLFPGGIFHESLPQSVNRWPAMSFTQVSQFETAEDMEAPNDDKLDEVVYQFDISADKSALTIDAADTFLQIMRNFRGTMTATRVQHVRLSNVSHLEEKAGDKLMRRISMDFSITYDV